MVREEQVPQSSERRVICVDGEELVTHDDGLEYHHGRPFTGYSSDRGKRSTLVSFFTDGLECGLSYVVNHATGYIVKLTPVLMGGAPFGGLFEWNDLGSPKKELIIGPYGANRVTRTWSAEGSLESDIRAQGIGYDHLFRDLGLGFVPWVKRPGALTHPRNGSMCEGILEKEVRWDPLEGRYRLRGDAFWGNLLSVTDNGRTRMRQVLDGRDEGPAWEWAPSGKLVLQGVLRYPYGRVGPWHEWDETGRLASETIYDAFGNHIIDRSFDEAGNLAHEQHHEPTRLWRDPDTGQQRPAPWLWF